MTAVPLDRLRVMPPVGAPIVWTRGNGSSRAGLYLTQDTVVALDVHGWLRMTELGDAERATLAIDLSAPTTPRIDGADVAAGMLYAASGRGPAFNVRWSAHAAHGMALVWVEGQHAGAGLSRVTWESPTIDTDATDPREILAAVLVAVLGVAW